MAYDSTASITPHLATRSRKAGGSSHLEPKAPARSVMFSFVCESKVGFSMEAETKTHRWFFTMKGFTLAALCFLASLSTRNLFGGVQGFEGWVREVLGAP